MVNATEPVKIVCFKGATEICEYVKEDPKQIVILVQEENLPAWKKGETGIWKALNIDLDLWMIYQRNKYLKDTPKYLAKM